MREKQLKGGSRKRKIALINSFNSEWKDLYEEFFDLFGLLRRLIDSSQRHWELTNLPANTP